MVLVTTKASNILEDLETLRLFSRVVSFLFLLGKHCGDDVAVALLWCTFIWIDSFQTVNQHLLGNHRLLHDGFTVGRFSRFFSF